MQQQQQQMFLPQQQQQQQQQQELPGAQGQQMLMPVGDGFGMHGGMPQGAAGMLPAMPPPFLLPPFNPAALPSQFLPEGSAQGEHTALVCNPCGALGRTARK